MPTWSNLFIQDRASPLIEQLIFFHDHSLLILAITTILVGYLIIILLISKRVNRFLLSGQSIEIIWTFLPAIILLFIAFPSLRLLYLLDEIHSPILSLKTLGHQWYWRYEYIDFQNIEFDSYITPEREIELNTFRLLDVDNRLILPLNTLIRIIISTSDVLHSWTIPALGIKLDGTPGRINQTNFIINRPGLFFGQCSEICGANHRFMPIVIERIPIKNFTNWAYNWH